MDNDTARMRASICKFVRENPERFRAAGRWLDGTYTPEACAARDLANYGKNHPGDLPTAEDWQSSQRRLRYFVVPDLLAAFPNPHGVPDMAFAERVLLVAFILAQRQCDSVAPKLTEFQDWSHGGIDHEMYHDLSIGHTVDYPSQWTDLTWRCWTLVDEERQASPGTRTAAANDEDDLMDMLSSNGLSSQFRELAARFDKYEGRDADHRHLETNIRDTGRQAGRLLVKAIDAGAFPQGRAKENRGWWDRRIGRVPGSVFTLSAKDEAVPDVQEPGAPSPFNSEQYELCWVFAVGSWLVRRFPDRFRDGAAGLDWRFVATDGHGGFVDKKGKTLTGRWYKDGQPLPASFRMQGKLPPGNYQWKLDGEPADRADFFTPADWLAHHRNRAEVYGDACRLLADLIDAYANSDEYRDRSRAAFAEFDADRFAAQFRQGPSTLRLAVWARYAREADHLGVSRYAGAKHSLRWILPRIQERTGIALDDTYLIYVAVLQFGEQARREDLEHLHKERAGALKKHDDDGLWRELLVELRDQVPELAVIIVPTSSPAPSSDSTGELAEERPEGAQFESSAGAKAAVFEPSCEPKPNPQPSYDHILDSAMLSSRDLAIAFNIDIVRVDALRKRLDRFRRGNDDGWTEATNRKPREPGFLYRVGNVRSLVMDFKASGETSSERPVKK